MRVRYSFSSRRTGNMDNIAKQRKKFPPIAKEVIQISDVVLEILDARFIEETRNKEIEEYIKNAGKKIIYVLNKSDIAERKPVTNFGEGETYIKVSCKKRQGISKLRTLIKIEVKKLSNKSDHFKKAHVGIIGYPNTGKSSLINILSGKSGAGISSEAGYTKGMQKIRMTSDILIIDTPGVIPENKYSTERQDVAQHAKVGARSYDRVKDPEFVVFELMKKYSKNIEDFYGIDSKNDPEILISELSKRKIFLSKAENLILIEPQN